LFNSPIASGPLTMTDARRLVQVVAARTALPVNLHAAIIMGPKNSGSARGREKAQTSHAGGLFAFAEGGTLPASAILLQVMHERGSLWPYDLRTTMSRTALAKVAGE